jgi:hypothetical protein
MRFTSTLALAAGLTLLGPLPVTAAAPSATTAQSGIHRVEVAQVDVSARRARPRVLLTMDRRNRLAADGTLKRLRNFGSAKVSAVVVRRDGGAAKRVRGAYRKGWAARLPMHAGDAAGPRAAIRISNKGGRDRLDPGRKDFVFGADFRLDGASAGGLDDGDNLIQRGIFNRGRQYKIQVDMAIATCRIKGSEGAVLLNTEQLQRKRWHRVRCQRVGDRVTLKVWRITRGGTRLVDSVWQEEATGAVTGPTRRPLSVGGRLTDSGKIPGRGSDPFNGIVDRPFFDVG